jgi:hypothetical protein
MPLFGRTRTAPVKAADHPESAELAAIVNHVIASENLYTIKLMELSPRVETYIQYYQPDYELGDVTTNDSLFLGRLKFDTEAKEASFIENPTPPWIHHIPLPRIHAAYLRPSFFALEPLAVDWHGFDRKHYTFEPIRWEYLGDLRCLAIDVHPREPVSEGAFKGRIWVEDHGYNIVRLNGTRVNPPKHQMYGHFDCWRENLQPGLWLPVYIYNQESDMGGGLRFKAETRLWGYDLTSRRKQQEWTSIQIDAPAPVRDSSEHGSDLSPVESRRQLSMDAENNVLDRLEKARLIAPPGPVDKVLETVVNNLRVTNHLDNLPPIQCRVMETTSLESFSLAYTIVVSRGLLDVLPDESSLAMILAHEIAHIALGHKLDPKYAFNDRMEVSDENLLASLDLARSAQDETAADARGLVYLQNSPYKDKLTQAGLFLRAASEAAPNTPHLFGAHLGNGLSGGDKLIRMSALVTNAPKLNAKSLDQVAALPLGSRVQVSAWDGSVVFTDRKSVPIVDASEKLPFRLAPIIPYLRTCDSQAKVEVSSR